MFGLTPGIPNIAQAGVAVLPNVDAVRWRAMLTAGLSNPASAAGLAIGAALGTAIASSVGAALQADRLFTPFQEQLTRMRTLAGESAESVEMLGRAALDLAPTVGRGPQELAEALSFIVSSGFEGAAALDVLDAAAHGAAIGMGTTAQVADGATSAVNAYGSAVLSAGLAVDILTVAAQEGKGEVDAYATSIGRVTGLAAEMGVRFDEVAGAASALTLTGLSVEEAVTSIQAVLTTLLNPGGQAADVLEQVGLSAQGLRSQLSREGLLATLDTLKDSLGGNAEQLGLFFGNVRAARGFLQLMGAQADKTAIIMGRTADAAGATARAFGELGDDRTHRRAKALAEIQAAFIDAGGRGGDAITSVYESLAELLPEVIPDLVETGQVFLDLAADVLPRVVDEATTFFRLVAEGVDGLSSLVDWLGKVGDAAGGAATPMGALRLAFERTVDFWRNASSWATSGVADWLDDQADGFAALAESVPGPGPFEQIAQRLRDVANTARDIAPSLKATAEGFDDMAKERGVPTRVKETIDALGGVRGAIDNAIEGVNNYGGVVSGMRGPDGTILGTYDELADRVQNAVDKVGSLGSAMLELASPGLGAVRAVERFNEVYGDALADGIMTDEERAALIEPFLEVQARLGDLDGTEALAFRDIITGVWEDLGGATEDLFGEGGVMPVLIDDFGRVVAEVGPMLADNSDTWGSDLLAAMTGAVDASWPSFEDETATRADGVGRSIPRLIAEGIDAEWGLVDAALGRMPQPRMPALLPAGGAGTSGAAGAGGGVTVNVTQNNPVAERGSASLTRAGIQAAIRLQMAQRGVPGIG